MFCVCLAKCGQCDRFQTESAAIHCIGSVNILNQLIICPSDSIYLPVAFVLSSSSSPNLQFVCNIHRTESPFFNVPPTAALQIQMKRCISFICTVKEFASGCMTFPSFLFPEEAGHSPPVTLTEVLFLSISVFIACNVF